MNRGSASRSCEWRSTVSVDEDCRRSGTARTYFSYVDQTTHEILVAQCIDSLLGLIPCCVFHNSVVLSATTTFLVLTETTYPHPYIYHGPGPIRQSNVQTITKRKTRIASRITHWRPPSTFHSEVIRHRRRELLQLHRQVSL